MSKLQYDIDWLIETYQQFFNECEMEEQNIRNQYEIWKSKRKTDNVLDFMWYIFQVLTIEVSKQATSIQHFYKLNRFLSFEMVLFTKRYVNKKGNHLCRV